MKCILCSYKFGLILRVWCPQIIMKNRVHRFNRAGSVSTWSIKIDDTITRHMNYEKEDFVHYRDRGRMYHRALALIPDLARDINVILSHPLTNGIAQLRKKLKTDDTVNIHKIFTEEQLEYVYEIVQLREGLEERIAAFKELANAVPSPVWALAEVGCQEGVRMCNDPNWSDNSRIVIFGTEFPAWIEFKAFERWRNRNIPLMETALKSPSPKALQKIRELVPTTFERIAVKKEEEKMAAEAAATAPSTSGWKNQSNGRYNNRPNNRPGRWGGPSRSDHPANAWSRTPERGPSDRRSSERRFDERRSNDRRSNDRPRRSSTSSGSSSTSSSKGTASGKKGSYVPPHLR